VSETEENPYRLRYKNPSTIFLIARDRSAKMMLLGGLGGMGVGVMWAIEEFEPEKRFENWETAPEQTCPLAERRCTANCALPRPEWAGPYSSWPRCWLQADHEGRHSIGYEPEVIW